MKKQNKRNQFTRMALALLLILSMLGNTLIFPTVAQETVAPVDNTTSSETPSADESTTETTSTPTLPEPILLTAADIPEFISATALTERGAVERMRSEETNMSSVIFRNSDGTRTMYMYGLPVKYTSADGTVRDKSTNLVSVSTASVLLSDQPVAQTMAQMSLVQQEALQAELGILDVERAADTLHMLSTALTARQRSLSDMAYTTLDNDVYALFPTNLAKGMTLVFGEHSVRMTPAGTGMTVTAGGNVTKTTTSSLSDADATERLLYPNVFGLGTAVQYTPTLTGVKEEILLSRNVGKNSFAFLLETGGLVLTEQNGQFVLIDSETEQQVGKLGEIIVFDSAGQVVRGNMTAQTILAGQKYGITISVDQEFLASATYPVSIDPTMDMMTDDISSVIEDIGLYNHEDAWGSSFEGFPYIGKTAINDYYGGVLYRFPFIYDSTVLPFSESDKNPLDVLQSSAQIGLAWLCIKPLNGVPNENDLKTKASSIEWSSNGMRICDANSYSAAISGNDRFSGTIDTSSGDITIDITDIMRSWFDYENGITISNPVDPEKGLFLYTDSVSASIGVGGTEHYDPICSPYLYVEYIRIEDTGPYYINNKANKKFLLCTDPFTLDMQAGRVADLGTDMEWMLYYLGGATYALSPVDHQGISFINSTGTMTINAGTPANNSIWTIITDGTEYVFRNTQIDTNVFSFVMDENYSVESIGYMMLDKTVTRITDPHIADASKWRLVHKDQYIEFPDLLPTSVAVSPDGFLNVYERFGIQGCSLITLEDVDIFVGDSSIAKKDGCEIYPLLSGRTVPICISHHPTGYETVIIMYIGVIAEGKYFFLNAECDRYMQIDADTLSEEAAVGLWSFKGNELDKWELKLLENGNYKIISCSTNQVLTAPSETNELIVPMTYTGAEAQQWCITIVDGMYKLSPQTNDARYMTAGSDIIKLYGYNVELKANQSDNKDEWILIRICDVSCIGIPDESHTDDHTSTFPTIISNLNDRGFQSYEIYEYITADILSVVMRSSKIVIINAHGTQTDIGLNDSRFDVSMINNLPDGALNNLQLVLFVACETGKDGNGANNLVNAMSSKGAQVVIGFENVISCSESEFWVKTFFKSLGDGATINSAIADVESQLRKKYGNYASMIPCYKVGNLDQPIENS